MNRYVAACIVTLAVLLGGREPLGAQERPIPSGERPAPTLPAPLEGRGWLGLEFSWEQRAGAERPVLIVRQVMPDSPAERAELRPGDRIQQFGGAPPEPGPVRSRAGQLRPGEVIVLELLRPGEDRVRSVALQADRRPAVVAMGPGGEWVPLHPDSFQVRLRLNLDSMRTEMERFQSEDVQVVFRRMIEEGARLQEETRGLRREDLRILGERLHAAGEEAGVIFERTLRAAQADGRGPLVVLRAGQRVVGGAELTPLNPDLARYFGTESGVLAVEVLEDTPASRAGLRAGDVIVRVGDEPVTGISGFREALERGYRNPPVPVTVVREGREVSLRFPA